MAMDFIEAMKVLSIKQPWAWLIIHGGKDIENRKWRTKFRGRFMVHASKAVDREAMKWFAIEYPSKFLHLGSIIGSVELTDVVESSSSKWFQGPIGFILKDPRPEPIRPLKGKLGFFEL